MLANIGISFWYSNSGSNNIKKINSQILDSTIIACFDVFHLFPGFLILTISNLFLFLFC